MRSVFCGGGTETRGSGGSRRPAARCGISGEGSSVKTGMVLLGCCLNKPGDGEGTSSQLYTGFFFFFFPSVLVGKKAV